MFSLLTQPNRLSNVQKKQRRHYSGKKKKHTLKTQVVINKETKKILCLDFSEGKRHDFSLFKDSRLPILKDVKVLTDTGYLGILNVHSKAEHLIKKTKKNPLTLEDKKYNRALSKERIIVENVIGCVKKFRILSETYRNRRKRFSLRFNLISGIYNYELT